MEVLSVVLDDVISRIKETINCDSVVANISSVSRALHFPKETELSSIHVDKWLSVPNIMDAYLVTPVGNCLLHIDFVEDGILCSFVRRRAHYNGPNLTSLLTEITSYTIRLGDFNE